MQKLEDYLYDFIGIFIPGFFLVSLFWLTTLLFFGPEGMNDLLEVLPLESSFLMNADHVFVRAVIEQKVILVLMLIISCYLLGLILSGLSHQYFKQQKEEDNKIIVYNENIKLLEKVELRLSESCHIDWSLVKQGTKWITVYRLANLFSGSREEKSSIQLLLSKTILSRSLSLSFGIGACYTILLCLLSVIFDWRSFAWSTIGYILSGIFYAGGCGLMYYFFSKDYRRKEKILSNEAVLILHKSLKQSGELRHGTENS